MRRPLGRALCVFGVRATALVCLGFNACTYEEATPISWAFGFECEADAERTDVIELQVAKGGCPIKEPVVFETWTSSWSSSLSRPQGLPAGDYAFLGTALDASGRHVASQCKSVRLPAEERIALELQATGACEDRGVDPQSDAGSQDAGVDSGFPAPEPDAGLLTDAAMPVDGGCQDPSDRDDDGVADCIDECPDDNAKVAEGQCGCGNVDDDLDQDGTADCNDECPTDPNKAEPGTCGCNAKHTLGPGERLLVGEYLCGPRDDSVRLTMEEDGNLHLLVDGTQTWVSTSKTDSMGQLGIQAKLQLDGNLVIRTVSDAAVWNSGTPHSVMSVTSLFVNADATVTIVREGSVVWSAGIAR